jgi:hypothetical protein
MAFTGILLNHPAWIAGVDLKRAWLPGDYEYRDWNRAALRGGTEAGGRVFLFGEPGVWELRGGAPVPFSEGLPEGAYGRDVRALAGTEGDEPLLFAGTRAGLFVRRLTGAGETWRPVPLAGEEKLVVDLAATPGGMVALTRSHAFRAPPSAPLAFAPMPLLRAEEPDRRESLFRLIFEMHYGGTWGPAGRTAVDAIGAASAFLAFTGAWFWWRRRRGTLARGRGGRWARSGLLLHARWGAWLAPFLLFVGLTGIFQRPPFLVAVAEVAYPRSLYPAPAPEGEWHDKLRRALYLPGRDALLLATVDGFHEGPADGRGVFQSVPGGPPVSVMGVTALAEEEDGVLLVGSMTGLYRWDRRNGAVADAVTGEPPPSGSGPPVGDRRVAGYVPTPEGVLWTDYERGLRDVRDEPVRLPLPPDLADGGRISLWHALFEIHNGRIFSFLLGWWAWIVIPLGGLFYLSVAGSGLFDRYAPRLRPKEKGSVPRGGIGGSNRS